MRLRDAEREVDLRPFHGRHVRATEDRLAVDDVRRVEAEPRPREHDAVGGGEVRLGDLTIVLIGRRVGVIVPG